MTQIAKYEHCMLNMQIRETELLFMIRPLRTLLECVPVIQGCEMVSLWVSQCFCLVQWNRVPLKAV